MVSVGTCAVLSSLICFVTSEIGEQTLIVIPNPSDGQFKIDPGSLLTEAFSACIYDLQLKKIWEASAIARSSESISLAGTTPGCYILELKTSSRSIFKKLLIDN